MSTLAPQYPQSILGSQEGLLNAQHLDGALILLFAHHEPTFAIIQKVYFHNIGSSPKMPWTG